MILGGKFTFPPVIALNIHYFQHSSSEGLGEIEPWARRRGHSISATRFHLGETPPSLESVDWLIVMGGAMNIYEHRNHPWLVAEKRFLAEALEAKRTILGICLGAQLIADALGGKVFQNPEIEIGWFPVRFNRAAIEERPALAGLPGDLTPLHWHGDTFSLPPGAIAIAESSGCRHQAFLFGERVMGLQFHLEVGQREVTAFLEGEPGELGRGRFIQSRAEIAAQSGIHLPKAHQALELVLNALESVAVGG